MTQEVPKVEHPTPLAQPYPHEQVPMQVPPIQPVEPLPQVNIEIHEIHSDLEEKNSPSTCPINFYTSMTSSIPTTQFSGSIIDSSFPKLYFSEINLSQILSATTITSSVLIEAPRSIYPPITPIPSTSSGHQSTPTSPNSFFPQLDIPISFHLYNFFP